MLLDGLQVDLVAHRMQYGRQKHHMALDWLRLGLLFQSKYEEFVWFARAWEVDTFGAENVCNCEKNNYLPHPQSFPKSSRWLDKPQMLWHVKVRVSWFRLTQWSVWEMKITNLSVGNSMTVWNFPCKAAGPSPTSMYLLSSVTGEFIWAWVLAWASSRLRSLVEGDEISRDLGRDKELWPENGKHLQKQHWRVFVNIHVCVCVFVPPPSRISVLSLVLKRTSTWLRMNSTTTDWIRTSMKAAVPLKQADSICLDLTKSQFNW